MKTGIERPKEAAPKKAERKWANHDLRRRYKDAKEKAAPELEPTKTTVVTVVNLYFDQQRELNEIVKNNRRKFIAQMKKLVKEGRDQGIKIQDLN